MGLIGGGRNSCWGKVGHLRGVGVMCLLRLTNGASTAPRPRFAHPLGARTGFAHRRTQLQKLPHRGNYVCNQTNSAWKST